MFSFKQVFHFAYKHDLAVAAAANKKKRAVLISYFFLNIVWDNKTPKGKLMMSLICG